MVLNAETMAAALVGHRALFLGGLGGAKPRYEPYAMRVPSTKSSEDYHWGGGIPQLREWKGKREVRSLALFSTNLPNRDYELTLGIPRNAYEDDALGIYASHFRMLGEQAAKHPDKLFFELLAGGFAGLGYDEVAFFSASHPRLAGGTQSNLITSALDADAFAEAITALRKITDEYSEPLDLIDDGTELHLIVPPDLEGTAEAIVKAQFLASGASNPHYNKARIVVSPRLTVATEWYLSIAGKPIRPFTFQMRREPTLVLKNQPDAENVFWNKEVVHGVDGRWAMGYGLWQLMVGSTGLT